MPPMKHAITKWTMYMGALLVAGPGVAMLTGALRDVSGGHATTLLANTSLVAGFLAGIAAILAGTLIGGGGSRVLGVGSGTMLAGIVICWSAWRLGTLELLARVPGQPVPLLKLAIENLAVSLCAIAVAVVCTRFGKGVWSASEGNTLASKPPNDELPNTPTLLVALVAGAIACGAAAYFVATNGLKGQTVAAATVGGIAAAVFSQLAVAGKRSLLTPVIPVASVAIVATIGPIAAMVLHGDKLDSLIYVGKVFPLARPISLEWAAGALMGVPLGLSWTASSVDPHATERIPARA